MSFLTLIDFAYLMFSLRYGLPIVFVVINNNGIALGVEKEEYEYVKSGDDLRLGCVPVIVSLLLCTVVYCRVIYFLLK